jgi:crotonobetainyl-CoA:carnitine CoA-transferase CaiB-like acyl-CoA transferase
VATILDLTHLAAAYGPRLLAESGHRVIRIEPADGDDVRRLGPFLRDHPDLEHGAYHQFLNAGKQSLTLDAGTASGSEILLALAAHADGAIVSRPFPVDAAALREANPRIVLVDVDDVPNELIAYARSGLLALTGHPGQPPVILGGHAVLSAIGLYVAVAAAAALLAVQLGQPGGHIEVSAAQCMESLAEQAALQYHTTGKMSERRGFRGAITAVSGAFPCADGYWMVSLPHSPAGWARLMEWVDDPVLAADASLADEGARLQKRDFILDRLSEWSLKHANDDLVTQAQARHIPAAPVATALDLARDPQLVARGFLREMDHRDFGAIRFPVGAIASRKGTPMAAAPRLGEHTGSILRELGYSAPEQQSLVERRVV